MRRAIVVMFVLGLVQCASGSTSLDIELVIDRQLRFIEISGTARDGRAAFPFSSVQVASDIGKGNVVIVLPESAPLTFELGVRGLTADRSAMTTFTTTVTLLRNEVHQIRIVLGPPAMCNGSDCSRCGDGRIDDGETCDDGNEASADGCAADCSVESMFECVDAPSVCTSVIEPIETCGDGIVEAPEACDDGNRTKDDGCSDSCRIDDDWVCVGEPSVCMLDCSSPCTDTCPRAGCCTSVCGSGDCQITCPDRCQCAIDCTNSETCNVECKKNSFCTVDCDGANNCDQITCKKDAQCVTLCGSANNCSWERCHGQDMVCAAGVLTCDASCP